MSNQINDWQNRLFKVQGMQVKRLQDKDQESLQALLIRCSDYIQLVIGLPPAETAAQSTLQDHPEGKTLDDKLVLGFFTQPRELMGMLDVVRDYPAQGDWWLGLLLLDPAFRRQGVGRQIYTAFEGWAKQNGAKRICLGVIKQNQPAYRFWQSLGFETLEERPARDKENAGHLVITMERMLID